MAIKQKLPMEVHDHFRKANILHGYVANALGEASKHALETGQELLAAKKAVPHGRWEAECNRLFDGSLRTAQFYMAFVRDFGKLKSAEKSALLMLEGTLDGAAKKAAKPKSPPKPQPDPDEPINIDSEPVDDEPEEMEEPDDPGEDAEDEPPAKKKKPKPPKKLDKKAYYQEWTRAIGPLMRTLDKIATGVGEKHGESHKTILGQLDACTEEMQEWMGVK